MRKIGLIGGISWLSTRTYYEYINRFVQRRVGTAASPPLLIDSLDYADFAQLESEEDWDRATERLCASARRLETGGAQAILITSNAMHRVYDRVAEAVSVPILHIADTAGARMKKAGATQGSLLGMLSVMNENFFRRRLVAHGVDLLPPDLDRARVIDRIIREELKLGKKTRDAERMLKTVITVDEQRGAKSIILACTELDLVVDVDANILPIFDCSRIHCEAAADWILGED